MCGILAVLGITNPEAKRSRMLKLFRQCRLINSIDIVDLSSRLRHRGPDWSGAVVHGNNIYAHERLSIVGLLSGEQPMLSTDGDIIITVNGEIYNYKELMASALKGTYKYETGSDCEVLLYLVRAGRFLYLFLIVSTRSLAPTFCSSCRAILRLSLAHTPPTLPRVIRLASHHSIGM